MYAALLYVFAQSRQSKRNANTPSAHGHTCTLSDLTVRQTDNKIEAGAIAYCAFARQARQKGACGAPVN